MDGETKLQLVSQWILQLINMVRPLLDELDERTIDVLNQSSAHDTLLTCLKSFINQLQLQQKQQESFGNNQNNVSETCDELSVDLCEEKVENATSIFPSDPCPGGEGLLPTSSCSGVEQNIYDLPSSDGLLATWVVPSPVKPFTCSSEVCSEEWGEGDESEEAYVCAPCGDTFSSLLSIKKHFELDHAEGEEADGIKENKTTDEFGDEISLRKMQFNHLSEVKVEGDAPLEENWENQTKYVKRKRRFQQAKQQKASRKENKDSFVKWVVRRTRQTSHSDSFVQDECPLPVDETGSDDEEVEDEKVEGVENPLVCPTCGKEFPTERAFRGHLKMHAQSGPTPCHICNKVFKSNAPLQAHLRTHTREKPFFCSSCDKSFSTQDILKRHMFARHLGGMPKFPCALCGKVYRTKHSEESHRKRCEGTERFLEPCPHCQKTFTKVYLQVHIRSHTGEKPFECSICKKRFALEKILEDHYVTHTGAKNWRCEKCGKGFGTSQSKSRHLKSHNKPFQCPICGRTFAELPRLKEHANLHTGNKPFQCSKCAKTYPTKQSLTVHLKTHEDKRYCCERCGKAYALKSALQQHILVHDLSREALECHICADSFLRPLGLKKHLRRFHGISSTFELNEAV